MKEIIENDLLMMMAQTIKEHCRGHNCIGCIFHDPILNNMYNECMLGEEQPDRWEIDIYEEE